MTPEELKAERAALERAIEQRQRQIDQEETLRWCKENERHRMADAQPVVTRSPPYRTASPPAAAPQRSSPFTPAETALLTAAMGAVAEVLNQEQRKASETQRQIREEMQEFCRREVDRMAQRLRNEALQERLDLERSFRQAEQQRRHQGAGLPVSEMIEINPRDVN